jgi:hypothetical protein
MKRDRWWRIWKKIEHWLVIAIFLFAVVGGLLSNIFSEELGMQKQAGDDAPAACADPYGRC